MKVSSITTIGRLVTLVICMAMGFFFFSVLGILIALFLGIVIIALFNAIDKVYAKQEQLQYKMELLYNHLKEKEPGIRAPQAAFARCNGCQHRYDGAYDFCPFCGRGKKGGD